MIGRPLDKDGDEDNPDMEDQKDDDFYTAAKKRSEQKKVERNKAYTVAPKFLIF